MKKGILNVSVHQGVKRVIGEITTYRARLKFELVPDDKRRTEDSPSHTIIATGLHGGDFEAGVAWEGEYQDRETGQLMPSYGLVFNVPEIWPNGEMKFNAWGRGDGQFEIVDSKPKEQKAAA